MSCAYMGRLFVDSAVSAVFLVCDLNEKIKIILFTATD